MRVRTSSLVCPLVCCWMRVGGPLNILFARQTGRQQDAWGFFLKTDADYYQGHRADCLHCRWFCEPWNTIRRGAQLEDHHNPFHIPPPLSASGTAAAAILIPPPFWSMTTERRKFALDPQHHEDQQNQWYGKSPHKLPTTQFSLARKPPSFVSSQRSRLCTHRSSRS